jgi:hypothetical protein
MRGSLAPWAIALAAALVPAVARAQDPKRGLEAETEKLARDAGAAVAGIRLGRASGAAFLIDQDGHLLTTSSMATAGRTIRLTFRRGIHARARVV